MNLERIPALVRGIEIIRLLKGQDNLSLEQIASSIKAPKASISRVLQTLESVGVVHREYPSKRYSLLQALVPLKDPLTDETIQKYLDRISEQSQKRSEFYRSENQGLRITHVSSPKQQEVTVNAQVGYLRTWDTELEAVCAVGHAFSPDAESLQKSIFHAGDSKGENKKSIKESLMHIELTREQKGMIDREFNSNGVRRLAAPLIGKEGYFHGILALAETSLNSDGKKFPDKLSLLHEVIHQWMT